jgi:hypothetical protein
MQGPDPRIPIGAVAEGGGRGNGPGGMFGTLGSMMQIKEQQQIYQLNQRKIQQQQEDDADDDAIRGTLQKYARPDEAVQDLWRQGRGNAASKLGKNISDQRKAQTAEFVARNDGMLKALGQASQIVDGVVDDATLKTATPALTALLEPYYGQGVRDMIPTTYGDGNGVKLLKAAGTTVANRLTAQRDAGTQLIRAYDSGLISNPYMEGPPGPDGKPTPPALDAQGAPVGNKFSDNYWKARDHARQTVALSLSQVQNKTQLDSTLDVLHNQGIPLDMLQSAQSIPWDDANPDKSRKAIIDWGRTQAETDKVRHDKAMEDIAKTNADRRAATGSGTTPAEKPLSSARQSVVDQRRNARNTALEKKYGADPRMAGDASEEDRQAAIGEYADDKLQIENQRRNESRQQSLEDTAQQAVDDGDKAAYDKIASIYDGLMRTQIGSGKDRKVVQIRKLGDLIKWAPSVATPQGRRSRLAELNTEFQTATPARQREIQAEIKQLQPASR